MLTEKDLVLYPLDKQLSVTLRRCTLSTLSKVIKKWFDVPELQPANRTAKAEDYMGLTKPEIIEKMKRDWSDGFRAIQLAQMELATIVTDENAKKQWKVFRVLKEGRGKLNLDIDAKAFEGSIAKFLTQSFDCYFYAVHDKKSDLYWMRIHVISDHTGFREFVNRKVAFMVYYPHTEFVMFTGIALPVTLEKYVREAILHTFNADKILGQTIRGQAAKHLAYVIKTRKSQGVFSELRTNINYTNPLDIKQKSDLTQDETYVEKGEPSRRIKPLDEAEISARLKSIAENFSHDETFGRTYMLLDVKTKMLFPEGENNQDSSAGEVSSVDQDLSAKNIPFAFQLELKGSDVSHGLRTMISSGQIKAPVPGWIEEVGSKGITKLFITEEGASEYQSTQDDEELEGDGNDDHEEDNDDEENGTKEDNMDEDNMDEDVDDDELPNSLTN